MHDPVPWTTILIIAVTCLVSITGFRDPAFVDRFIFSPQRILAGQEGWRLITSGFLHANWGHLFFNMFSLYAFGRLVELEHGAGSFLIIYFSAIVGGNLLSLLLHRHHIYLAYGASGGVCGIIYAFIFLFPGSGIMMMFMPFEIPAWLYAIVYLGISYYGLRSARDNIGHDAHLGGAIIGLLTTTALYPEIIRNSTWLYAAVMAISIGMLIFLLTRPLYMPSQSFEIPALPRRKPGAAPPSTKPQADEVNRILDKISKSGMDSLTKAEHETLVRASRKPQ